MSPILACNLLEAGSMTDTFFYPPQHWNKDRHSKSCAKWWTDQPSHWPSPLEILWESPSEFILIVINVCFIHFGHRALFIRLMLCIVIGASTSSVTAEPVVWLVNSIRYMVWGCFSPLTLRWSYTQKSEERLFIPSSCLGHGCILKILKLWK